MKTHKPANISFLILILLFILSQTAFALSAKLVNTADSVEIDQNAETDEISPLLDINNSSPVLSYDSTPFNDIEEIMLEKKMIKQILKEKAEKLAASENTDENQIQTLNTQAETNQEEDASQPEPSPEASPKTQIKGVVKWVNANELNVRSEPDSSSELVQTIKRGDRVTYYETIGEWARIITWQDRKGYVLAKYLVNSANEVVKPKETATSRGTSSAPASSPQSSEGQSLAQQVVSYAKTLLGVKYVWGGNSKSGLDCSGLTKYVYSHFGIYVPRSSSAYWNFGTKVDRSNIKAGDILLFDTNGGAADVSHVGIYLGDGTFIHASSSKGKVVIQNLSSYRGKYMGARRVIK
ncbi:MAG: SH3 domain-containing protein [Clostridiaceae bacterium]|nr:SH3 domain-containing protein [Clostridiaceae bacterium]